MKITSEKVLILIVSIASIALLSILGVLYNNTKNIKSASDLVGHTHQVLSESDKVLLDVLNIESGSRGYSLTHNEIFLEPYNIAITTINSHVEALAALLKDYPSQQLRMSLLKSDIEKRLIFTKNSIERIQQNIVLNDTERIATDKRGKILTDNIRGLITDINVEEFHSLKQRQVLYEDSNETNDLLFLLLVIIIVLILTLIIALVKNQRARNKIAEELKKSIQIAQQATQTAELATRKAEESTKLKEAFLSNMSHEIRTPMNAIMGFSDLLYKEKLEEKQKEYVKIIKIAGKNLLTIINDILDISKIEAGMMTFEEHPLSVREIFKSMHVMLLGSAKEKNLELSFTCSEDVPSILLGDPLRLTQIIINLVGNAIKFTQKGSIQVFANSLKNENGNVLLEFSVKDTGIGIAPDKIENIFERFTQAESQTTRKYGGTGLGLSISKQLTELQGGKVSVKSELNVGSEFSFCIPFKNSEHTLPIKENTEIKYDMEELSKLNILLVEDNPLNVKLMLSLFSENNMKLQVAENGSIGIEKLKENDFDIILMDMEMPVMNGYEAATIIRNEMKSDIPIIAMTAHAMAGEQERCLSLGMNGYISKPVNSDFLFKKMYDLTVNLRANNKKPGGEQS